jgi:hypothetical protein
LRDTEQAMLAMAVGSLASAAMNGDILSGADAALVETLYNRRSAKADALVKGARQCVGAEQCGRTVEVLNKEIQKLTQEHDSSDCVNSVACSLEKSDDLRSLRSSRDESERRVRSSRFDEEARALANKTSVAMANPADSTVGALKGIGQMLKMPAEGIYNLSAFGTSFLGRVDFEYTEVLPGLNYSSQNQSFAGGATGVATMFAPALGLARTGKFAEEAIAFERIAGPQRIEHAGLGEIIAPKPALLTSEGSADLAQYAKLKQELMRQEWDALPTTDSHIPGLWSKPATKRGDLIHEIMEDLPHTFKCVDCFDRVTGTVTNIKSLDLYRVARGTDSQKLGSYLRKQLDNTSEFSGGFLGEVRVEPWDIASRQFTLVIPANGQVTVGQMEALRRAYDYGRTLSSPVTLKVLKMQ